MRLLPLIVWFGLIGCVGYIEGVDPVGDEDPTTDGPPPGEGSAGGSGSGAGSGSGMGSPPATLTYTTDIAPKLTFCAGCHAIATPAGNYRTDSYTGVLGNGQDGIANVIAGNPQSLLVVYLEPAPGKNHKNANAVVPGLGMLVRDWVVDNGAAQ